MEQNGWTAVAFEQHSSVEEYRKSGGIFVKKHPYRDNAYKVIEGIYVPHANPEMAERSGKDYLFNHHTISQDQIDEYELDDRWTFTDALVEEIMNNSAPTQEDHVANYWSYLNDQGISRDTLERSTEQIYGNQSSEFTEEERQNLIDSIMGVREEENRNRSQGDKLTPEEMMDFRELLQDKPDEDLEDMWYQWVGEWLASRDQFYNEVNAQFQKTLKGEQDYGFV
jgi:hypothetical protein